MKNKTKNILWKELKEVFRDKKSLAMMIIVPVLIPLIVLGMSAIFEGQMNTDLMQYNQIGFAYEPSATEKTLIETLGIDAQYGTLSEIEEKFKDKEIYLYLTKNENEYTMHYDPSSDGGSATAQVADMFLNQYKVALQEERLVSDGYEASDILDIITISSASEQQENFFATYIVGYAFLFIIMAITISATYPATDTTAGEKERGTLETLLTFPIRSQDIIIGKLLSVTISSIITGILSLILTLASFALANHIFTIYETDPIVLSGLSIVATMIVIIMYSLFISGLCIAVSSMSKTFKEAQSALTPLTFISFFPGMIAFMVGIKTTPVLFLVPFLNFFLILNDIASGIIQLGPILLVISSTILYTALVIWYIIKQYKSEKVLFTTI